MTETAVQIYEGKDLSINRQPSEVLGEAQKAAKALTDVISRKKKPVILNGEQYLEYEDWQTVGRFYGITVRAEDAEPVSIGEVHGFKAKAVAYHIDREISSAVAYCMKDEKNWRDRPLFMLASMSQTRACAKALRNVLSWVVVLAGYRPTPAEEMEGVFEPAKAATNTPAPAVEKPPAAASPGPIDDENEDRLRDELWQICEDIGKTCGADAGAILHDLTSTKDGKYGKYKASDVMYKAHKRDGAEWSPLKVVLKKAKEELELTKKAAGKE